MKEDILHFLWKHRRFISNNFKTVDGEKLEILSPGIHNQNAGPDFLNARIRINNIEWLGHIELHVNGSDWKKHNHSANKAYNNVILHVVYFHDVVALNSKNLPLPTLELMGLVNPYDLERCDKLLENENTIPCFPDAIDVESIYKRSAIERALVKRLEEKSKMVLTSLENLNNDWEQLTFETIAKAYGFGINNDCFEATAKSIRLINILRLSQDVTQIEALLFGQAGLLPKISLHNYPKILIREYEHLKVAHGYIALELNWKFARTHPQNFPTLRMAQLAAFLHSNKNIFSNLLEINRVSEVLEIFMVPISDYWKNHFSFEGTVQTNKKNHAMGQKSAQGIIINAIIPLLFTYARVNKNELLEEKMLRWFTDLPAEFNSITNIFVRKGDFPNKNAADSQGIIQLYKHNCLKKKCLQCQVGNQVLGKVEEPVIGYEIM